MSDGAERPNPDILLQAVEQSGQKGCGELRVFIGMAAGVGKTYAMLQAAHLMQKQGKRVVVGVVETHGRKETEALLAGLPILPLVTREYRGKILAEMDLDRILAEKPHIVLVDELAHTNIPGSRHDKRYQDVEEILAAGIGVFTTVNVQHLESRKVIVEDITGIRVLETVPDIFLDRAKEISLIDIDPDELIRRIDAGLIYDKSKTTLAKGNFFSKVNLKALRELALRFTVKHVERDLLGERCLLGEQKTLKAAPRLQVAVYASPYSENLLRWTKMLADSMGGSWVAAYINDGTVLSHEEKALLGKNFALVNSLGGELVTTVDEDTVAGLLRVARQNQVNLMVLGKSHRSLLSAFLGRPNVTERLLKESGEIDVLVLSASSQGRPSKLFKSPWSSLFVRDPFPFEEMGMVAVIVFLTWFASAFCQSFLGYRAVGLLFLFSVFGGSLFLSRLSIFALALISGFIWNWFFIPPRFTVFVSAAEDIMMLLLFFAAAVVMGSLTHRLRLQKQQVLQREERSQTLYRVTRGLGAAKSRPEVFAAIANGLSSALGVCASVLVAKEPHGHLEESVGTLPVGGKELAVASWVYLNRKPAGMGTDTLSSAAAFYSPLLVSDQVKAVLAIDYEKIKISDGEMRGLVETICYLGSAALQREEFRERSLELLLLEKTQLLYDALFDSVSHELKTPLAAIQGSVSALLDQNLEPRLQELLHIIVESSDRLLQTVENLLDMSRIESGMLRANIQTHDVCDVVNGPLSDLQSELAHFALTLDIGHCPAVRCDIGLTQVAIRNILRNCCRYAPKGSVIKICARPVKDAHVEITIRDNGLGFADLSKIFEKFYRGKPAATGGLGLGLSIAKRLLEVQGGTLTAKNDSGAVLTLRLPKGEL